ncbi:heme exporter protein CcmD [Azospirillum sp. ST 5-10]|uniref:heme exporter protein CcmD n=1 Tax=unclassified Azospirillum TaxID=2630922 RepID=UPI003F49E370
MTEFFDMGGYAAYVWPSYGVTALVLIGLLAASLKGLRGREATLKALEGSRPPRRRARREAATKAAVHRTAAEMGEG